MTKNILNFIFLLFIASSVNAATVSPGTSFSVAHDFSADPSQPSYTQINWGYGSSGINNPTLWQPDAKVHVSLLDNLGNNVFARDYANPFGFAISNASFGGIKLTTPQSGTFFTFILTGLDATFDFSDLYFHLFGPNGLSERATYVVASAVPIPAAAFLFAPVLLGFIALRRKVNNA